MIYPQPHITSHRITSRDTTVPSLYDDDDGSSDDDGANPAAGLPTDDGEGLILSAADTAAADADAAEDATAAAASLLFEPVTPTDLPPALARSTNPLPYPLGVVRSKPLLRKLTRDGRWYITNGTPAGLIARLAEGAVARVVGGACEGRAPLRVLDVCAAPGGKGLAVWDVVVGGQGHPLRLVMNDVSEEKTARIQENLAKYGIPCSTTTDAEEGGGGEEEEAAGECVRISIGDGAALSLAGEDEPGYDVVIVDAPCSNAGVLGRRPEARWRLADGRLLGELEETQLALLRNARSLLSRVHPAAEIWYMTCSILKREDEGLVARACRELALEVVDEGLEMKVLPGEGGLGGAFDGGYGVALRRARAETRGEGD
jgi:16S rRNA (cytosine967-C5)-methyltransferase